MCGLSNCIDRAKFAAEYQYRDTPLSDLPLTPPFLAELAPK